MKKRFFIDITICFVILLAISIFFAWVLPEDEKDEKDEKEKIYVLCGQTREASEVTLCKEVSSSLERRY